MKVVRFLGDDLSTRDCHLLTDDLTLRSNGTAVFETRILAVGINFTYNFFFGYYDNQWNIIFTTPNLSHRLSEEYLIDEAKHEITFDTLKFEKVEHVKITFNCEKEGSDNPPANASSGATALTPKGEGNRTQDASQGLPARTLARTPQPSPPEPSSPEPSAPVVRPVAAARVGSTPSEPKLIDINTASADDLNRLGERFGKAIIAGRAYRSVHELVSKRVLKRSTFSRIKDRITVNTAAPPTAAPMAPETVGSTAEPKLIDINMASADVDRLGERFGKVGSTAEPKLIDINTASADDLNRLGERFGKAIIAGRPYRSVHELVSKRVLKRSTFSRIKDLITVNTAAQPSGGVKALRVRG